MAKTNARTPSQLWHPGDPSYALPDGRYHGRPEGKGKCDWCRREDQERALSADLFRKLCVDRDDCNRARLRWLIETGSRPQSWYRALEEGGAEQIRECKRAGIDVVAFLESRSVDSETANRYSDTVGLPTDEGEDT